MTIPAHWALAFVHATAGGATTVQDIIDAISTAVTATLPSADRWTESPAGDFTNADGAVRIIFVTDIALRLSIEVRDGSGNVIIDRSAVFLTGFTWRIHVNRKSITVMNESGINIQCGGGVLDQAGLVAPTTPNVYGFASHTSVGGGDGDGDQDGEYFMRDNGIATTASRIYDVMQAGLAALARLEHADGSPANVDEEMMNDALGTARWAGRIPQAVAVDDSIALNTDVTIRIDTAQNAVFRTSSTNPTGGKNFRIAYRKS